jgi:hypothetical protein
MGKTITITKFDLLVLVFGTLITAGLAWHQYILFLRAYFDPGKGIVLMINVFGEANAELVLLTGSIIIGTIATIYVLWVLRKLSSGTVTLGMKKGEGEVMCDVSTERSDQE